MPPVSVLLPVATDSARLAEAFACIARQTVADLDILILLNGSDAPTERLAFDLAASDSRARAIRVGPVPNLAAALNAGLLHARHHLIARMDADDACPPNRLAVQVARLEAEPTLAAVGCAWDLTDAEGRVTATIRPPTDALEMRWRLLLENPLAHGSMLMHRSAVLAAGGYDPRRTRAQDYDLWLRLSAIAPIAAVPETLYTHRQRAGSLAFASSREQARAAADLLAARWAALPPGDPAFVAGALSDAMSRTDNRARGADAIAAHLRAGGPTRDALLAWLWTAWRFPPAERAAINVCRRSRVREVGATLRAASVRSVHLWGAGAHTAWLLAHAHDLGVEIAGLVDDRLAGRTRHGLTVAPPSALRPGEHALISTDSAEDEVWRASLPHRQRGVIVWRLYAENECGAGTAHGTSASPSHAAA
ncbi:MAG: glycosyltransferase [Phycisphaeraceae bacterium]|nr:glycosyltransferase [Phycisphaeraceae bacterium]